MVGDKWYINQGFTEKDYENDVKIEFNLEEEIEKVKPFESLDLQRLPKTNTEQIELTKEQQEIAKRIELMKRKLQDTQ